MSITRAEVVAAARTWLGVPWRHQGRTRLGVDCVGLLVVVARDLAVPHHDPENYGRRPDGTLLGHFRANCGPEIPLVSARAGDVVVFADRGHLCHAGILADGPHGRTVIHSVAQYRRVSEIRYAGEWQDAARVAFAFPGVDA